MCLLHRERGKEKLGEFGCQSVMAHQKETGRSLVYLGKISREGKDREHVPA